jgi:VCBS repeat-containing protein
VSEPHVILGGDTTGTVQEDVGVTAGVLTANGSLAFDDADEGETYVASAAPVSGDPPLGTLQAQVISTPGASGPGQVDWSFTVDNDAVQRLKEGESVTQTWSVGVTGGTDFKASLGRGFNQAEQKMAALSGGGFVVVWTETRGGAPYSSVYARIFDEDGKPVGPDFKVNTTDPELGAQVPDVAALDNGGFVVVWRSDSDGPTLFGDPVSWSVSGQVFDEDGTPVGTEFQANTTTVGDQDAPEVAGLENGQFVVTWQSDELIASPFGFDYTATHLAGQVFDAYTGTVVPVGGEFRITPEEPPGAEHFLPNVEGRVLTPLAGGGFVQSWSWTEADTGFIAVLTQAYDDDGLPLGGPVYANVLGGDPVSASSFTPVKAVGLADGGYVLAWATQDEALAVAARVFDADGQPTTDLLVMPGSGLPFGSIGAIEVTALADGGFVVVWWDSANLRVGGQVFDENGVPEGNGFQLDALSGGDIQTEPKVVAGFDGGFAVIWTAFDASNFLDIRAQEFDAAGNPVGGSHRVNTHLPDAQSLGEIVALPMEDGFAITWVSFGEDDPFGSSIHGRVIRTVAEEVTVTITGADDAPEAMDVIAANPVVEAGHGGPGLALLEGTLAGTWHDVDAGETELLQLVRGGAAGGPQSELVFDPATGEAALQGVYGTLYLKADGSYRYVLDNADTDTQALAQGEEASEVFAYTVANGTGAANEASATLTVHLKGTNDAPVATAEVVTLDPATLGGISVSGTLADNISDPDAEEAALLQVTMAGAGSGPQSALSFDPETGEAAVQGTYGTLFIKADGSYRYVLNTDDPDVAALNGGTVEEAFSYTVANGAGPGNSASSTISVTVTLPEPPVILASALTPALGVTQQGAVIGPDDLQASTSLPGSPLTYTITSLPAGRLMIAGQVAALGSSFTQAQVLAGLVTYLPGPVVPGPDGALRDSFGYTLSDGAGGSVAGVFSVAYEPYDSVQTAPVAGVYTGGAGNELMVGRASLGDSMLGAAGADLIIGGGGHDWIDGGGGANRLFGGTGNDTLYSGGASDLLMGGDGHDRLSAGGGADTLFGEAGHDLMYGGGGEDVLYGATGNDTLYGGLGNDLLMGETGNDLISGEDGDDIILGGADADSLYGGDGNDQVLGEGGADSIWGGSGDDLLEGGESNDRLSGDAGADTLLGGTGVDLLIGGDDDDVLDGGAGADSLLGGAGNDLLLGGAEVDRISGGDGADTLWGGAGNDQLNGGAGADSFLFGSAAEAGDAIQDFDALEDVILISASGFGIDPSSDWLVINATGLAEEPGIGQLIYNSVSGWLWWDEDGSGGAARIRLATISGAPALDASDFQIIA